MAPRRFLPALLVLFVGSGCAALIYEIVWFQLLQLVIGSSSISLGILLGTFMGGMCLGSLLLPRVIPPRRHPLRVYALLELGIGALGLLILVSMPLVGGVYTAWAGEGMGGVIFRAVIAGICLLPPTMLMGATLPAISRWVKATPDGVAWLGFFYGGNIGGGVVGSLVAGFYLLRVFDVGTATLAAAIVNIIVFAIASVLARQSPYEADAPASAAGRAPGAWPVYTSIALSGTTALRETFGDGPTFVGSDADSIAAGIDAALVDGVAATARTRALAERFRADNDAALASLATRLGVPSEPGQPSSAAGLLHPGGRLGPTETDYPQQTL